MSKNLARHYLHMAKNRIEKFKELSGENPSFTSDPLRAEIELAQLYVSIANLELALDKDDVVHVESTVVDHNARSRIDALAADTNALRDFVHAIDREMDKALRDIREEAIKSWWRKLWEKIRW